MISRYSATASMFMIVPEFSRVLSILKKMDNLQNFKNWTTCKILQTGQLAAFAMHLNCDTGGEALRQT